jgi:hypothetical protein
MKVEELRIGNWLHYCDYRDVDSDLKNKDFKVTANDILYLAEHPDCDWIEPIILTEDKLIAFGFRKCGRYFDTDTIVNKTSGQ